MRVQVHLPRQSEAEVEPASVKTDITIKPKFYKKVGWVPIFYFTTLDSKNRAEQFVLIMSAANRAVRVERLKEVVPACDGKEEDDATDSG